MDRLRFKCRERGGPITLFGETDMADGSVASAKLLTFSPTKAADIEISIESIERMIHGEPEPAPTKVEPFPPAVSEPEEEDDG